MDPLLECEVVIVGLGPVGAVLGNLLGAAGVALRVFERDADIVPTPRAVAFDGEIMRVFQAIGLAETLEPLLRASTGAQFVDPDGNVMLRRAAADEEGPQGWRNFYNFHQPVLEKTLREGLCRYPNVTVHLRHEVYAIDEASDFVQVRAEDMSSGALRAVRARYVIGCDGARSLVRRLIGSPMEDLGLHEPWVVADFELKRAVNLPSISTQYCDPVAPVTYVHVVDNRRRWEFKLDPGSPVKDAANPDRVWAMARQWITPDDAELTRAAVYTFHSLIAERWRRGRLLIAGDSAHQTPPFMGQGLCAGIRDAANLAWKMIRVLRHGARDTLLDTYGSERRAHALAFINMAVRLGFILSAKNADEMRTMSAEMGEGGNGLVYPVPKLGPGVHDASPQAGVVTPQPRLDNGMRLDDMVGYGFALLGTSVAVVELPEVLCSKLRTMGVTLVPSNESIDAWLSDLGQPWAMIRPDRYLFSSFEGVPALGLAIERLMIEVGGNRAVGARVPSSNHIEAPISVFPTSR